MDTATLQSKIEQLPTAVRTALMEYLDFLLAKYSPREQNGKSFRFDWEGGLSHLKGEYTSVELQHKIAEWR